MATLNWIGKQAVTGHHRKVPYRLLKCDKARSAGDPDAGNLLVQGDNLEALKALLPFYAGQVKCIYIYPPYNTGDEGWVYNDNVNSPEIKRWLGEVVGKEAEDLCRHDKWLCMMYPRLVLLREFLRNDGVIFVSIDENEVGNLRLLMNEVFGIRNALGTLVWKRRSPSAMRDMPLSIDHEYILVYGADAINTRLHGLPKSQEDYPNQDERGNYASTDLTIGMDRVARPGQYYEIVNPRTGKKYPPNPDRVWRFSPETMDQVIADQLLIWPDDYPDRRMSRPRYKTYFDPNTEKPKPVSSWIETAGSVQDLVDTYASEDDPVSLQSGMTQEGGRILQQVLGVKAFAYPKPLSLVKELVRASTTNGDLFLDSFAGSGTTGHAVMQMNKADGGNRRFILVEIDDEIATNVTAQRLARASAGYHPGGDTTKPMVEGLGSGFRFCRLGKPLFDANGNIAEEVSFADLAAHVFFTETGSPIPKRPRKNNPLLGVHQGRAIYLLFNGVLGDRRPRGGNVLTHAVAQELPPHPQATEDDPGQSIVFGEACRLGPKSLAAYGITFRQIPFELKVS